MTETAEQFQRTQFPPWRSIADDPPSEHARIWAIDSRGLRHHVEHGIWIKGEVWDSQGDDWNGFTHWIPFESPTWTDQWGN